MNRKEKVASLSLFLTSLYPETECFLHSSSEYGFLIAVILSAQARDKVVNQITPLLFKAYPSLQDLADANEKDILKIIKPVGLGPSKAHNILLLAKILVQDYQGKVPHEREVLQTLPGVGHKTAGVFLGERDDAPFIPVDTHVSRIAKRLRIVPLKAEPDEIEAILEANYQGGNKMNFHRQMILFGRNLCLASDKRLCEQCPLSFCQERLKDFKE